MAVGIESSFAPRQEGLRVGEWTVEPALDQISAAGKVVKLEPKAMAVLLYLVGRPGEVVSRQALLSAVWPDAVVVDDSLTQVVTKLRKALGDAPKEPIYIQTIAKRGYRLVAPVAEPANTSASSEPVATRLHAQSKRRVPWMAGAGIGALLLGAAGAWWMTGERVADELSGQAPLTSSEAARTAQPTIAIKPFEALGDDPQEVLLARGITADLVTDLSKVFGLWVIGVAPRGAHAGSESSTGAPSVRYLVSGSVQRAGELLRLHVLLTDAETGKQLWSERFDRALINLFAIQEELGPKILKMLPAKVNEAEMRRVAARYTRNLEAYEYFQRGQSALLVRQRTENEIAREMFRRAIELDAAFARAYAGLALSYTADYRNQWTRDAAAALDRAFEIAGTAHQINPDIPETYWVLAYVHAQRRQPEEALHYLKTALRLYPSFADGYALMGSVYTHIGRPADTIPLLRTAMRLNPQAGYLYFLVLGRAYLFLGDLEQAQVNLEHALSRNPASLEVRVYRAALYVMTGDSAAAVWEGQEIGMLQPDFSSRRWLETYPMTDDAQKRKLIQLLGEIGF